MTKKCPRCGTDNVDEATYCSSCGNSFVPSKPVPQVKVITPVTAGLRAGVPTSPVTIAAPGMCFYHPTLRATYVCNRCGRPIGSECAQAYSDLIMCPPCYRTVTAGMPPVPAPQALSSMPMILSLIAGILVLACAMGILVSPLLQFFAFLMYLITGITVSWVAILGFVAGFGIIAGALISHQPGYESIGGITVMLFSILGLLAGGGFVVGFILGLIGGTLALTGK